MTYNYHAHTARCGHASGTEEEYILRAIEGGITHMGFSDHMPYVFPDGYESYYRVPEAQAQDYFDTLNALRDKYKGQIDLKIGFEMEYYPSFFEDMYAKALAYGCEYLILGQHFSGDERPDGYYVAVPTDDAALLTEYVSNVLAAMDTGVFSYVAHPDLFHFTGDEAVYEREMRKVCAAAREKDIPLEINFLGMRAQRHYPQERFWKLAGEEGAPVTFGFDAHDVEGACDKASLVRAMELVDKYGLNYIGRPNLVLLQNK